MNDIGVIGCGVSGLSCAVVLAEAGYGVEVVASCPPMLTTSRVAAAYWSPFHTGGYDPRWAEETYRHFESLLSTSEAGISRVAAQELFDEAVDPKACVEAMWWRDLPGWDFAWLDRTRIPNSWVIDGLTLRSGISFTATVVHMPSYLSHLIARYRAVMKRPMVLDTVSNLNDLCDGRYRAIINCAGAWSARLLRREEAVRDPLHPVVGQAVGIEGRPGDTLSVIHTGHFERFPIYIVPRWGPTPDVIVGGTVEPLAAAPAEQTLPDPVDAVTKRILSRAALLDPRITGRRILDVRVGLRPARTPPRVELDAAWPIPVVHNYGHGGAGVTLSWGCAQEAARLLAGVVNP